MASPILPRLRFAENKGFVLPCVKHPTCREYAVALLTQQEERVTKLEAQKDEENEQLKKKVMDLEETLLRTQEENLRLVSELQKYQGILNEKEKELELQASEIQKETNKNKETCQQADQRIQEVEAKMKALEASYVKIVKMAVDRELQVHDYRAKTAAKDRKILSLEFDLARMKEQRREHEEALKGASKKIHRLERSVKNLEVSYANMVKMATDRELELRKYQDTTAAKDSEILSLQFQLARLKEQRAAEDLQVATAPG